MSSVFVVGASGFLGRRLVNLLGNRGVGSYVTKPFPGGLQFDATRTRLADISSSLPKDLTHVAVLYGTVNPDLCAREVAATRAVNVESVIRLLSDCFDRNLTPVYMSTDYVYSDKPGERSEDETRSPTTEYGRQKSEVEAWLETINKPWMICRSSKIVGGELGTHSVLGQWVTDIKAGSKIRCATDQIFTPGFVEDIAIAMIQLMDGGHTGIFHAAGSQSMSRYNLASLLIEEVRRRRPELLIPFETCSLSEIPFYEARPLNTAISTAKLQRTIAHRFVGMRQLSETIAALHFP